MDEHNISIIRRGDLFELSEELRGIKPIQQKFLEPNYLFAMEWRQGFLFGRVIRRRICLYKPWPLIDENGNAVKVSADGHAGPYWFRDPRNTANDILYLKETTNAGWPWFYHGSIGIKPVYINMYPRIPETQDLPGRFPSIDPIRPSQGHDVGYVNSLYSPYEKPTDFIEYVIPPLIHIDAEFYNKDPDRDHRPVCNILFALYWFQVLKPDVHRNTIRRIALREVPAAFFKVGFGDFALNMGGDLMKDWDVQLMSLDEAAAL